MNAGAVTNATYAEAKKLADARRYQDVIASVNQLHRDQLLADPQLCLIAVNALRRLHRSAEAADLMTAMEPYVHAAGDANALRRWQNGFANLLGRQGRVPEARRLLDSCIGSAERAGDMRTIVMACNTMGVLAITVGDVEEALYYWKREIVAAQSIGDHASVAYGHHNLGVAYRECDQLGASATHFLLAQEYIGEIGTYEEQLMMTCERALLLAALGDQRQAEVAVRNVLSKARSLANEELRCIAERVLGSILYVRRQYDESRAILERSAAYWHNKPNLLVEQEVNVELALIAVIQARYEAADEYRRRIVAYCTRVGAEQRMRRALERIDAAMATANCARECR